MDGPGGGGGGRIVVGFGFSVSSPRSSSETEPLSGDAGDGDAIISSSLDEDNATTAEDERWTRVVIGDTVMPDDDP